MGQQHVILQHDIKRRQNKCQWGPQFFCIVVVWGTSFPVLVYLFMCGLLFAAYCYFQGSKLLLHKLFADSYRYTYRYHSSLMGFANCLYLFFCQCSFLFNLKEFSHQIYIMNPILFFKLSNVFPAVWWLTWRRGWYWLLSIFCSADYKSNLSST